MQTVSKKVGMAILMSEKVNFKVRSIIRDKEGHFIVIKVLIHQDDIILNVHLT